MLSPTGIVPILQTHFSSPISLPWLFTVFYPLIMCWQRSCVRGWGGCQSRFLYMSAPDTNASLLGPMCAGCLWYTSMGPQQHTKHDWKVNWSRVKWSPTLIWTGVLQIRPWNVYISVWWLRKANQARTGDWGLGKDRKGECVKWVFTTYQCVLWLHLIHCSSAFVQKDSLQWLPSMAAKFTLHTPLISLSLTAV